MMRAKLSWFFMVGMLVLTACVRTVPDLPEAKAPLASQSGKFFVQASGLPTVLVIQRPATQFWGGFVRGSRRGAVYGFNVGQEWFNAFKSRSPEIGEQCRRGRNSSSTCSEVQGVMLAEGLLGWIVAPPTISVMAGLQEGFGSHKAENVENWAKAMEETVGAQTLQIRFKSVIHNALRNCCQFNLEDDSENGSAANPRSFNQDTVILNTDVIEVGLAEYHDEALPEPGTEWRKVNINPKMKKFANSLNFIFRKPPLGFYMLVRTKLIRGIDSTLLDERFFGYASPPLEHLEWTESDSKLLRLELELALRNISEAVITNLVYPSIR